MIEPFWIHIGNLVKSKTIPDQKLINNYGCLFLQYSILKEGSGAGSEPSPFPPLGVQHWGSQAAIFLLDHWNALSRIASCQYDNRIVN